MCDDEELVKQEGIYKLFTYFDVLDPQTLIRKSLNPGIEGDILSYAVSFKDTEELAGVMWFDYDTDALAQLISPLYEDVGDYQLIIYAKRIKELVEEIDIDYASPVY